MDFFSVLVLVSFSHPSSVGHLPRRVPDLGEHETTSECKRRDDGDYDPDETTFQDGEQETKGGKEKE